MHSPAGSLSISSYAASRARRIAPKWDRMSSADTVSPPAARRAASDAWRSASRGDGDGASSPVGSPSLRERRISSGSLPPTGGGLGWGVETQAVASAPPPPRGLRRDPPPSRGRVGRWPARGGRSNSSSSAPSVPLTAQPCRIRAISRAKISVAAANRSGDSGSAIRSRMTPTAIDTASAHASRRAVALVLAAVGAMGFSRVGGGTCVPITINVHKITSVKPGGYFLPAGGRRRGASRKCLTGVGGRR
jgi:hypothetical protein